MYFPSDINFIEYDEAIFLIKNELTQILQNNYEVYQDLKFYISNEQEFIKTKQQAPNAIYIVISYGAASVNFGQSVLPITITAIAEQNKIDKIQKLFADFASTYNLTRSEDNTLQQIYETPVVTSNFNKVYEGFRSVMYISGYLVVSKTANFFNFYYIKDKNLYVKRKDVVVNSNSMDVQSVEVSIDEEVLFNKSKKPNNYNIIITRYSGVDEVNFYDKDGEITLLGETLKSKLLEIKNEYGIDIYFKKIDDDYRIEVSIETYYKKIDCITAVFGGSTQLDSQTFYNYSNFTKSVAKAGTITFSVTTYLLADNDITNDVLDVYLKRTNINNSFEILISPLFGGSKTEIFKLVDCTINLELGQLPMITMTFTN